MYCLLSRLLSKVTVTCAIHQMFNVSALLLYDALKPATPLTNGAISETLRHTLDISQGSAATHLRCGRIFSDSTITNFLLIVTVK